MPLNNRYLVAAFDSEGEKIAFLSQAEQWVDSAHDAVCFPSQTDANHFIARNELNERPDASTRELPQFDHVQAVFVTVTNTHTEVTKTHANDTDEAVYYAGIYG